MGAVVSNTNCKMEALVNVTQMLMPMRRDPVALLLVGVEIVMHIAYALGARTSGVSNKMEEPYNGPSAKMVKIVNDENGKWILTNC